VVAFWTLLVLSHFTSTVTNPVNDIRKQAHQGSVAAIIQVLKPGTPLIWGGGRGRSTTVAHYSFYVKPTPQPNLTKQKHCPIVWIKEILESLAPSGESAGSVRTNSRINCEQQLLWLDEAIRSQKSSFGTKHS
jgi:hypothetical protein